MSELETIAAHLEDAGFDTTRFVQCQSGKKSSVDHTRHSPSDISGNYGIYAGADDPLVIFDIDDYGDLDDKSGLAALGLLDPTLEQESPHGGTHRFFKVETDGEAEVSEALEEEFDVNNPNPSWGEIRVENQYVVGAGSQLEGCSKDWCDGCREEDGGKYVIGEDRPIATVDFDTLTQVIGSDPVYTEGDGDESEGSPSTNLSVNEDEIVEYALEESNDEKLKRLFKGDYSDYGDDRSVAESALAAKLGWWLQGDKEAVRRAMDRANTRKWAERTDDSYRESVLEAVDELTDYYEPSQKPSGNSESTVEDEDGEERPLPTPTEFDIVNGCYGTHIKKTDNDGETYWEWVEYTNFQVEVNSYLRIENEMQIDLTVWPKNGDSYDVTVSPVIFNEVRDFKKEICRGLTTTFEGGQEELNEIKRFVGTQDAPYRDGTHHMGLHGDEWVTPKGVLKAGGWGDDPENVYVERGIGSERKWEIGPDIGDDFDRREVREALELLPKTREMERLLPVLGWFYSAPLRPLIHDWEDEFNLMFVQGDTGSGKTTTISTLWEAFGMGGDPLTADDTKFTLVTTLGSSNAVPMWFDEYKPSDMADYEVDRFWNEIRKTTIGGVSQRGNADKTTTEYHLHAPTIVSGEERVAGSAEERRGIFTTFRKDSTDPGTETARAYAELTGGDVREGEEVEYFESVDLQQHALAYYRFILSQDEEDLRSLWREAGDDVAELLRDIDVVIQEDLVKQGLQTIMFGAEIYQELSEKVGAETPVSKVDVEDAVEYVATSSQGGANRKSHLDTFFEVAARAASGDYLSDGEHYKFVKEGQADEELRMNLATGFDKVSRYARDHEIAEDLLNSKNDYYERIRDLVEDPTSYITTASQNTPGINRAVGVNRQMIENQLDDFEKSMFTDVDDGEGIDATRIRELQPGYDTVTAEVLSIDTDLPEKAPDAKGTIRDNSGAVDCISWDGAFDVEEGGHYVFKTALVGNSPDGAKQVQVVDGVTEIQEIQHGAGHTSPASSEEGQDDLNVIADGGDYESLRGRIHNLLRETGDEYTKAEIGGKLSEDPEVIQQALDNLAEKGEISTLSDGVYTID